MNDANKQRLTNRKLQQQAVKLQRQIDKEKADLSLVLATAIKTQGISKTDKEKASELYDEINPLDAKGEMKPVAIEKIYKKDPRPERARRLGMTNEEANRVMVEMRLKDQKAELTGLKAEAIKWTSKIERAKAKAKPKVPPQSKPKAAPTPQNPKPKAKPKGATK